MPTWRPAKPNVVAALGRFLRHRNVRSITARDEESAAWIREHLRPRVEVASSADLVFALPLPDVERPAEPPILGIVVRWREGGDDYTAVRALAARGRELGYRLRTIVLSTGRVRARDERALDEVGLDDVERVASDDLEVLTRAIGECTMLASHKFHGTVVAVSYGIPSISMSTTDKNRNLLRGSAVRTCCARSTTRASRSAWRARPLRSTSRCATRWPARRRRVSPSCASGSSPAEAAAADML